MTLCFSELNPLFTLSFSGAIQITVQEKRTFLIKIKEGVIYPTDFKILTDFCGWVVWRNQIVRIT